MPRLTEQQCGGAQRVAFLDMLSRSEGTYGVGDDGYNVLVGSTPKRPSLFAGYSAHPNRLVKLNATLSSTAAGRYQELYRYWKHYIVILGVQDFTPETQDRIALHRLGERKAFAAIDAGDIATAVDLCRNYWASLPGATYGQNTHSVAQCEKWFEAAGGKLA